MTLADSTGTAFAQPRYQGSNSFDSMFVNRDTSTVVQVADATERVFARRGLAALFWSNINPCGTFCLEMDKWLECPAYGWSQPGSPQGFW